MGAMTAKNTFSDGLIMDFAPDNTQATNLTNALNATLVTMNGNELSLLNDMGNGRVETALLPKGYVPVGTCEFGDIIYIVSYNPLINKSQIGCFPSPERNLDSLELNSSIVEIDTNEIGDKPIYKVLIQSTKLNPGDKYIVKGNFEEFGSYLSDYGNTSHIKGTFPRTLKLSVVSIEDSGKINYLDTDIKWYDDYYLMCDKDTNKLPTDIDSYQNAISSAYNVFSSKVSGKLAILAEYETIRSFSCSLSIYTVDTKDENNNPAKYYYLYLNTSWETDNNDVNPIGVKAIEFPKGLSLLNKETYETKDIAFKYTGDYFINYDCNYTTFTQTCYNAKIKEYEGINNPILQIESSLPKEGNYIVNDSTKEIKDIIINNYFKKDVTKCLCVLTQKPKSIVTYKVAPYMPIITLEDMAISNTIDFSKIGTGTINITLWRYFKLDNLLTLTFALEVYEEPNKGISKVDLDFFDYEKKLGTLSLANKTSYFGTFTYTIPLDTSNMYFDEDLKSNLLYGVNINIYYLDKNSLGGYDAITEPTIQFSRFLWTNEMYNDYYYNTNDFDELNVLLDIATELAFNATLNISSTDELHTNYLENKNDLIPYYSLSYTKLSIDNLDVSLKISPTFKNNYGTFLFNNNIVNEHVKVKCGKENISVTDTNVISDNSNYNDISLIKPLFGDTVEIDYPKNNLDKESLTNWANTLNDSFSLRFDGTSYSEKEYTILEAINGIPLVMNGTFYSKALFSTFTNGYILNSTIYKPFISSELDLEKYNIVPTTINGNPTFGFKLSRYMCSKDKNAHISAGYENLQAENTLTYLSDPDDNNGVICTSGNTVVNMSELYDRAKIDVGIFSQVDYGSFWNCNGSKYRGVTYLNKAIDKDYVPISSNFINTFGASEESPMIKTWYFNKNEAKAERDECSLYQLIIKRKDGAYLFLNAFARGHNVDKSRSLAFGKVTSSKGSSKNIITIYGCYTFAQYVASCLARIYYRDDSGEAIKMTVLDGIVTCSPYTETWSKDFTVNFNIENPENVISIQDVQYSSYVDSLLELMYGEESALPKCLIIKNNFEKLNITIHFIHLLEYDASKITRQISNGRVIVKLGITNISVNDVPADVLADVMYLNIENNYLLTSNYNNLSWAYLTKEDGNYIFKTLSFLLNPLHQLLLYLSIDKTGIYGELNKSNLSSYYLRLPSSDDYNENNYYGFNGDNGVSPFNII